MKTLFCLIFLSLAGTSFAETENCTVNRKFKGVGTLSESLSSDGKYTLVFLKVKFSYGGNLGSDNWKGVVARKDLSGAFTEIDVKPEHRFSITVSQQLNDSEIFSDYFNPGYKRIKSSMRIDEAQDLKSISLSETIYNDSQRVEGKNSIACRF